MVEGRRLALCDGESKSFENGAIQLAPIVPVPITFLFSIASAFAGSMALALTAMVGRVFLLISIYQCWLRYINPFRSGLVVGTFTACSST